MDAAGGAGGFGGGTGGAGGSSGGTGGGGVSAYWSKQYGALGYGDATWGVGFDGVGNIVVGANFSDTIDFGDGAHSGGGIALAKLDPAGNPIWSKSFVITDGTINAVSVAPSGAILIAGIFALDVDFGGGPLTSTGWFDYYVASFDAGGTHQWSKRFGDDYGPCEASVKCRLYVTTDAAGNVYVGGTLEGTVDMGGGPLTSSGPSDVMLGAFDAAGTHLWSKRFGGSGQDEGTPLRIDALGRLSVAGGFEAAVDFGQGLVTSNGGSDFFAATFDTSTGAAISVVHGGGPQHDEARDAIWDASGDVFVGGRFGGTMDLGLGPLTSAGAHDLFVARVHPTTGAVWNLRAGDAAMQQAELIARDLAGNLHVSAHFTGAIDFGLGALVSPDAAWDFALATIDPAGNVLASSRHGGPGIDWGWIFADPSSGDLVVSGEFETQIDFGAAVLTSPGGSQGMLSKIPP